MNRLTQLLGCFPRGHLVAVATLALAVTTAIVLSTSQSPEAAVRPLPLPAPDVSTLPPTDETTSGSADPSGESLAEAPTPAHEWIELSVSEGDTLAGLLQVEGIGASQVHQLLAGDPLLKGLTRIRPGDVLRIRKDDEGRLAGLEYPLSRLRTLHAELDDGQWRAEEQEKQTTRQLRYAQASISDSLFLSGRRAGMSDNLIMKFVDLFAYDVDFALDIREGDTFSVLYEELFVDGEKVGNGDILAAEFSNRGRNLHAIRYVGQSGQPQYLDRNGNALKRAFIRTPVDFARISSRFNLGRRHPVLNTIRAHRGVDYAAPTGTPIKATGNGRIEFAGVKGGYGNVIIIKHGNQYSTLYAHMSRFASGMRAGTRVSQGQVIGYVGATGLATGPHLHYEFLVNGTHRDPLTVNLPMAEGLKPGEKPAFQAHLAQIEEQMSIHRDAYAFAHADVSF